ncbi:AAA family ATPase [Sorangium sp. So ce134]
MDNVTTEYELFPCIHKGLRSVVHRARRRRDGAAVVIKLQHEQATARDLARFNREYEITCDVAGDGVIGCLDLSWYKNRQALILEDFGAESLLSYLASHRLELDEVLSIAIEVSRALGRVHERRVIHKDLNPSNILINPETRRIKLIDFSLATTLPREAPSIRSPNLLEGTLRYISPEQTGRMNRSIDYRSDFYSLGATMYEMLTGAPPFPFRDAMELVHCHIAREPIPPHVLRPGLPEAVSTIVLKLLAKMAEDRYQSAHGLTADLSACLAEWRAKGRIDGFVPGRMDIPDRFQIPQKLYGRAAQSAVLAAMVDRVSAGRAELMLVAGYSGIGKSALVNEIHRPLLDRRGYFISGKFDQLKRNIPYAPLIEAFNDLIRQLLAEAEPQFAGWKARLTAALGANAPVIAEVIPAVELLLGEQPPPSPLPPTESQNRFNFAVHVFVRALATQEHPLVLFLDDLQWADAASLSLIKLLMTDADLQHLCIIGAYRDNEVSDVHPMITALDAIREAGARVTTLTLSPLDLESVTSLVAETLRCDVDRAAPLAALLLTKTQGNPLFIGQLLESLYQTGLLSLDKARAEWRWDLDAIRAHGLVGSVVELMAGKIQKLTPSAQDALKLAACVGNRFGLDALAVVHERPLAEAAAHLWEAVEEGLVLPIGEAYHALSAARLARPAEEAPPASFRFLHDRVQQAAYSLIEDERKAEVHLDLGRLLKASTPEGALDEALFSIVNQYELGLERITSRDERFEVAELSLLAGRKAKTSAAYEPALRYFHTGLRLLPEGAFDDRYDLAFSLQIEAAEAEYLNTNLERAQLLADAALERARTVLDKVKVLELRMLFAAARDEFTKQIRTGLEALDLLGVSLPANPTEQHLGEALQRNQAMLAGRPYDALLDLPEMTDPVKLAAMRLLARLGPATYSASPLLFLLLCCESFRLCVEYGNCRYAPIHYISYGTLLAVALNDLESASAYSTLAMKLIDRFQAREAAAQVYLVRNVLIRPWMTHIRDTMPELREAVQWGLETGDLHNASQCATNSFTHPFIAGEPLATVIEEQQPYMDLLTRQKQQFLRLFACIAEQTMLKLLGRDGDPLRFAGDRLNEDEVVPALIAANSISSLCSINICKSMLRYLFGEHASAAEAAEAAEKYRDGLRLHPLLMLHNLYQSLALLALVPGAGEADRSRYLETVDRNQRELERWARGAPANFAHKHALVEAERLRVLGRPMEAMALFERAIRGAAEQRFLHEEAIALERCADLCRSLGWERAADAYLADAAHAYTRWGAAAKVAQLERRYPALLTFKTPTPVAPRPEGQLLATTSSTEDQSTLELTAMMKAARAISGEIVLERLLAALMRIIVENAGAQRGYLLIEREGRLLIEAEWASGGTEVIARRSAPLESEEHISAAIVGYTARTGESVVLRDAAAEGIFTRDPYVAQHRPRSVLCVPLLNQAKLIAVIYLENNLAAGAFTADRIEVLSLLSAQAALSIHHATLYATLEQQVEARTGELSEKNRELTAALTQLKATQQQLVVQEKLASLGALTAGIAHELRNPLNFVTNFAVVSREYAEQISASVTSLKVGLEQGRRVDGGSLAEVEELLGALQQAVTKIDEHGRKADGIIQGMLLHARGAPGVRRPIDLNAIVADSLKLAMHAMPDKDPGFRVRVDTSFDVTMSPVEGVDQELARVFINVLNNAWYAAREKWRAAPQGYVPTLTVRTVSGPSRAEVRIRDNGTGIAPEIADRIYNPFFTTKPPGEGTGLGLSLSHDIVVRGHGGDMRMETSPGEFTEFVISLPRRAPRP